MWAKQSTAATLIVGPILDSAGAEYASAVIGDLSISKNGGTLTAMAAAATLTHIANGQYTLVTTTGNLDTLGRAQITCNKSTYQMPAVNLMIVPAMVFDSMVLGTDVLQSDTTQIGGDTQSATDLKDFADAGYDPSTNKVQGVVLVDTTTTTTTATNVTTVSAGGISASSFAAGAITSTVIATDAIDADAIAANAVTEIQSGLATASSLASLDTKVDTIDGVVNAILVDTAEIGIAGAGLSVLATAANLATVAGYLDTEIAAILADTNELQTDWANGGRLDLILDIIAADTTTDIPALIDALPTAAENFTAVVTTALTESYAADGTAPTLAQALFLIQQALTEFTISGTTTTIKRLDGSTTAATLTLNDGTTPTGVTRAS